MKRRDFIALLGGAVAWPLAGRAQQGEREQRIGVLMGDENDLLVKTVVSAFIQSLADFGWIEGRNVRMDFRYAGGDGNRTRALAQELVGLQPDIIATDSTRATAAIQRQTRTIPIVFGGVVDPVGSGLVAGLARPGGYQRLRRLRSLVRKQVA
jgi:putative ABC transport system substrate-binding protein